MILKNSPQTVYINNHREALNLLKGFSRYGYFNPITDMEGGYKTGITNLLKRRENE